MAVGVRYGTADPETLFPDHEVAVGFGCGKANTKTPRTDSTIAPPKNQRFSSTNVSWLLDAREGATKNIYSSIILFAKDYTTMTSGVARGTVIQEMQPGAGFETDDFVQETLRGLP